MYFGYVHFYYILYCACFMDARSKFVITSSQTERNQDGKTTTEQPTQKRLKIEAHVWEQLKRYTQDTN